MLLGKEKSNMIRRGVIRLHNASDNKREMLNSTDIWIFRITAFFI